jgi:MFS family permease
MDTKMQQRKARELKEIQKWEQKLAHPQKNSYLWYLLFVITIVYIADEITSTIGNQMNSVIAQDLFAPVFGAEFALARMGALGAFALIGTFGSFLYKPLSDKYGRKPFLIINTVGMGLAMIVISVGYSIPVYLLGAIMVSFFIPHDVQMLYLMESVPAKRRVTIYAGIKAITTLFVILIPLFRNLLMGSDISRWHHVYLALGIFAMIVSVVAAVGIHETEPFMRRRIAYLKQSDEERKQANKEKSGSEANGGLGAAFRYGMGNKQLRWLLIGGGFAMWGSLMTGNYEAVMSQGYMTGFMASGMDMGTARVAAAPLVTSGLMLFPVGQALLTAVQGFISDHLGRKQTVAIMGGTALACYVAFFIGANAGWNSYAIGFLSGCAIGAYWGCMDTCGGIMCTESTPTNLRASIMSVQPMVAAVCTVLVGVLSAILVNILGDAYLGPINMIIAVPGMLIGILMILLKVRETKGVDLNAVTGHEG